jgi:hypothetical protein
LIRDWMTDADGGFQRAADFLMAQLETELIPRWEAGRALADEFGLEFMVYEGGTLLLNGADYDTAPPEFTDFAERFTRSDELTAVYEAMAEAWAEIGTGPFAWYNDTGRPGPWGYYGHFDSITFDPQPRTGAITDANGLRPTWGGDTRPADTFDNGRYDAGTRRADLMVGSALGDRLYGLAGRDSLFGYRGDDLLWGGEGRDTITGGQGSDTLVGGNGADSLIGGQGRDVLTGGAGADAFVYYSLRDRGDRITDFSSDDVLVFLGSAFGGLAPGRLAAGVFQSNITGAATTAEARFIFDRDDGRLWFDADGRGGERAVLVVTLQDGALLEAGDFLIL